MEQLILSRHDFLPSARHALITQGFGQNPDIYAPFGFAGHEGIDFGVPEGTVVYAPHDGIVTVLDEGAKNYGLSVTIDDGKRRSLLAHLSKASVQNGKSVSQGDPIGLSGRSGAATGPHLHWTFKQIVNGKVAHKDNGYNGAIDVSELTRLWLDQSLHHDAQYTDDAKPYLAMTFADNQYLRRVVA